MSKAVLVIDMPEKCLECPMLNGNDECILQDEDANFKADTWDDLKKNCPLVPMPEEKPTEEKNGIIELFCNTGWNAYRKAIGGTE